VVSPASLAAALPQTGVSVNQDVYHDNFAADSLYKGSLQIASVAWSTEAVVIAGTTTNVTVPTITLSIRDQAGQPYVPTGTLTLAFTAAQQVLLPDQYGGTPNNYQWQTLTNSSLSAATPPNPLPTRPNSLSCVKVNETLCDASGTCVCKADTTTTSTLERNIRQSAFNPATATATIQLGVQLSGGTITMRSGRTITFPAQGTVQLTSPGYVTVVPGANDRQVVMTSACNNCHGKVFAHGSRVDVQYCTTCHTSQAYRKNIAGTEWMSVEFARMIHGIHAAKQMALTYNLAGIDPGFTYPQDVRHCDTCHQGTQAQYSTTMPGTPACIGCHGPNTRTSTRPGVTTECLNVGMKFYPDAACSASPSHQTLLVIESQACNGCHNDITAQNAHAIPGITPIFSPTTLLASDFSYSIVSVKNTTVGAKPVVRIQVNAAAVPGSVPACDIKNSGYWTQTTSGASRLQLSIGWGAGNYTNAGSGITPVTGTQNTNGQVQGTNALGTASVAVAGQPCQFDVTSAYAIPVEATGKTLAVYLDGHPAIPADSTYAPSTRLPVANAVTYCNLAATATCNVANPNGTAGEKAAAALSASSIVDLASCNKCHWQLSLHGGNRQGALDVCTTCHNTEATAFFSSPADYVAIDFKTMVHRIHNADYQIYSTRSGSVTEFYEVTYPYPGTAPSSTTASTKLIACTACHVPGKSATTGKSTYFEPRAAQNGTSTTRGNTVDDNLRTTKWYATCGSCHRWGDAMAHMEG
ncbi:MAG TPA: OmcA/MtrC family decaheme c-type cytochrome, partial [Anaeromyxobacteraceae bacterium]|nr:OmcA/MtrC family decaheme c-type cytochrome [Anaeromyxobacteraceae bacterium]